LEFYKKPQVEPYSYLYPNIDWPKLVVRDYATSAQADMSLSGGTDDVKYFASLGYIHEGDLLNSQYNKDQDYDPGFGYNRFNFRGNLDFKLTKTTTFSANISGYIGNQKASGATFAGTAGPGVNGLVYSHLYNGVYGLAPDAFPAYYPDGFLGINPADLNYPNPLVNLNWAGALFYNRNYLGNDFKLEQKLDFITNGLSVSGRIAFDKYVTSNGPNIVPPSNQGLAVTEYIDPDLMLAAKTKQDSLLATQIITGQGNTGVNEFDFVLPPWRMSNETVDNTSLQRNLYYQINLNYNRSFNKHNVTALAIFDRRQTAAGSEFAHFQEDWVGRVTYNYDSRYFTEFNGAYNGSEKFAPKYRFGFFPSAALGWMISNERFMQRFSWIDNLKLRGSIGAVGSDLGIPRWGYIGSWLFPGTAGYFMGMDGIAQQLSPYSNYTEGVIANPDIRWETAIKENIGVDFSALKNEITFTGDVFHERRKNIFMTASRRNIPVTFGAPPVPANLGETETHGYEFTVGYNKRNASGFGYNVSLSMTRAVDKVVKYEDPELLDGYQKVVNFQIGQVKSQVNDGFMNTWDDVYGSVRGVSNMPVRMPGDWDLIDYNGDGVVDNFDVVPYGFTNHPQNSYNATLGASYKGLSLMIQFFAVTNVNLTANPYTPAARPWTTVSEELADYWTSNNPNTFYKGPRLTTTSSNGQFGIYDASYLRLKTAVLAYDFSGKWIRDLGVSNARIALTGNNLIFWSAFPMDSETSYDIGNSYPAYRQFDLSLNISF
jgi:TonB-linked SusC/RagA family outer membrane protein